MCLIIVSTKQHPSQRLLRVAEMINPDGAGVAWVDRNVGAIRYRKGLAADEVGTLMSTLPLPIVIHFRLATHGGISPFLCHPFPITRRVPLSLSGRSRALLFHNGVWGDYLEVCLKVSKKEGIPFLSGDISDTRAMAWLASVYGVDILSRIDRAGRKCVFTPNEIRLFGEWTEYDTHLLSNSFVLPYLGLGHFRRG